MGEIQTFTHFKKEVVTNLSLGQIFFMVGCVLREVEYGIVCTCNVFNSYCNRK